VAALRSHPDWLLIAESRGHEFMDVFQSVLTGHPVITTLHAEDGYLAYKRMLRLVLMHEVQGKAEDVLISLQEAFPVIIHLKIKKTETIERYIETISVYRHHQLTTFHHQMDQVMVAKLLKDIQ
jgi:pilus assembly protein CpaF